ncbi:MAG: hypothetical protein WC444_07225 [Candidatus Paceibacterota bacterium]
MEQSEYRLNKARTTDELETDNDTIPDTKRILLYGYDGSDKVRIAVTSTGLLKVVI